MPSLPGKRRVLDSLLIFAISAYLIWPLFTMNYMDNWGSIESTFISDARMLRDRGFHAQWQPNWYLGTRFDYVYPPALRYGTAALSKWLGVSTARSYHIYTATLYCLGIASLLAGSRIRGARAPLTSNRSPNVARSVSSTHTSWARIPAASSPRRALQATVLASTRRWSGARRVSVAWAVTGSRPRS